MKVTKENVLKRQNTIISILNTKGMIYVDEMAELLSVNSITIRRDLQSFEKQGIIKRFYGGAMLIRNNLKPDPSMQVDYHSDDKDRIAIHCADIICDGDIIFINSSSTSLLILKHIKDKKITVITNNARVLSLNLSSDIEIILTGGEFYSRKQTLIGEFAINNILKTTATKAFIGVSGIDSINGISTSSFGEISINELMLSRCNGRKYIVCDSSKIGIVHNFKVCDVDLVDEIVTNVCNNLETTSLLERKNIKITYV